MNLRSKIAKLKKLLFDPEPDNVWHGVALAGALADPAVHAAFLDKVVLRRVHRHAHVHPGPVWPKTRSQEKLIQCAIVGLYGNAPRDSEHSRVRERLDALALRAPNALDAEILTPFTSLARLQIHGGVVANPEALERVEALTHLTCTAKLEGAPRFPRTLEWLDVRGIAPSAVEGLSLRGLVLDQPVLGGAFRLHSETLEALRIKATRPFDFAPKLPRLESLELSGASNQRLDLAAMPLLRRLSIRHCAQLETLGTLPPLELLRLGRCAALSDLSPTEVVKELDLQEWPRELEHLDVLPATCTCANPLHISLDERVRLRSIRAIGRFVELQHLSLRGCSALESLDGIEDLPALHVLDVRGCVTLGDLRALRACTARIVLGQGSPVRAGDVPDGAVLSLAAKPDLAHLKRRAR